MPFTLLSHQAPVLPLKLWRPRWFSGAALAIGSMAPDLEYLIRGHADAVDGHTPVGQLRFCLPLTLALVYALRLFIARPLAARLPDAGPFHLRDLAALGSAPHSPLDLLRVAVSALLGSYSHIFIDGFTHWDGFATLRIPFLRSTVFSVSGHPFAVHRLLQFGGSAVFALATVWMLYVIGEKRLLLRWAGLPVPATSAAAASLSPTSNRRFWLLAVAAAAVPAALRFNHDEAYPTTNAVVFWGYELMQAACFVVASASLLSLVLSLRGTPIVAASPPPPSGSPQHLGEPLGEQLGERPPAA